MRITGGRAKGRNLHGPRSGSREIRPTSDRTRQALFNILADLIPGSRVLDLYAGTGALGIEALSRGAELVVFVDRARQALELIHANLTTCFAEPRAMLLQLDLSRKGSGQRLKSRLPPSLHFDLILLDPPYEKKLAEMSLQMVDRSDIVGERGLIIVEERKDVSLPARCGSLELTDTRTYGETGIWCYRKVASAFG